MHNVMNNAKQHSPPVITILHFTLIPHTVCTYVYQLYNHNPSVITNRTSDLTAVFIKTYIIVIPYVPCISPRVGCVMYHHNTMSYISTIWYHLLTLPNRVNNYHINFSFQHSPHAITDLACGIYIKHILILCWYYTTINNNNLSRCVVIRYKV